MRTRILTVLAAALAVVLGTTGPAWAITNGVPDEGAHPQVGQLLFYVPDAVDPRFSDPGGWFTCSGTLIDHDVVLTAGHCTYGIGIEGVIDPDGDGSGGTDVWFTLAEEPDYTILTPPSSNFAPDDNEGRYETWSAALDASDEWLEVESAVPHPDYVDNQFFLHDVGVLHLAEPADDGLPLATLPTAGELDRLYAADKQQRYTAVGYGLEGSGPKTSFGGDTRRRADLRLVNLTGVGGLGGGISAKFSSNANTGGTCFGDSGGPYFVAGTMTVVAVVSYGLNSACAGTSGGYRIDQPDDLAFINGQLTAA